MDELTDLQRKIKKWKEVGETIKSIHDTLDATSNKKEWHYMIQLRILLTKAEEYATEYEYQLMQLQANNS